MQIRQQRAKFIKAFEDKWKEVVKEESDKSANFAKVWASYSKFREDYKVWRDHGYMK